MSTPQIISEIYPIVRDETKKKNHIRASTGLLVKLLGTLVYPELGSGGSQMYILGLIMLYPT